VRKLGKEAEGLVESGTIFCHVEHAFARRRMSFAISSTIAANVGAPAQRFMTLAVM
jgi:hypothetical protein